MPSDTSPPRRRKPRPARKAPPMSQRANKLDLVCDILKLLRTSALSRPQIQRELGYSQGAIERYTRQLLENGLLRAWTPEVEGVRGKAARLFAVPPTWGGLAGGGE